MFYIEFLKHSFSPSPGGFFLEAGSNDAEDFSDSLHFELNHGWKVGETVDIMLITTAPGTVFLLRGRLTIFVIAP
jgi:hypothetical protein